MLKATLLALLLSVVAATAKPTAGATTEIPFKFVDGFIIVSARVGASAKPFSFLVDSGASTSVLSLKAAERLRLPLLAPEPVQGVGAESVAYHIAPVKATAGRVRLTHIPIVLDLSNAAELCSHPVDGLLGMDFFANRIVQIDYHAQKIRLLSRTDDVTADVRVPLQVRNGTFNVPVGVNGSTHRWTRLDTGSNDSLHWVTRPERSSRRNSQGTIGFLTDPSRMFRASVQVGDRTFDSVHVAPHDQEIFAGEAGLLGNGILSRFTVTIDSVKGQMLLQESPAPSKVR